jgi:ankyrin repeat protein
LLQKLQKRKHHTTMSLLIDAARNGSVDQVHEVLKSNISIDKDLTEYGDTALIVAASEGNDSIVKILLDHGADILYKNYDGDTALINALKNGNGSTVDLLTHRMKSMSQEDKDVTLMVASGAGNARCVNYLLRHRASMYSVFIDCMSY